MWNDSWLFKSTCRSQLKFIFVNRWDRTLAQQWHILLWAKYVFDCLRTFYLMNQVLILPWLMFPWKQWQCWVFLSPMLTSSKCCTELGREGEREREERKRERERNNSLEMLVSLVAVSCPVISNMVHLPKKKNHIPCFLYCTGWYSY